MREIMAKDTTKIIDSIEYRVVAPIHVSNGL